MERGSFTRDFEKKVRFSLKGDFFIGDSVRYVKKALEKGISLYKNSIEEPGEGSVYRGRRRTLETERLSFWELCEGNLEGGLLEKHALEGSGKA